MSRLKRLLQRAHEENLDGMLLVTDQNIRYLTGFTGSDSFVLIAAKGNYFLTDGRYIEQAEHECQGFTIVNWRNPPRRLSEVVGEVVRDLDVGRLGFEKDHLSFELYDDLTKDLTKDAELVPTKGIVESFRYRKDEDEIQKIKKSCTIADNAFGKILDYIKPGITERELATELEYYLKKSGAEAAGFETILISGARTSLLHGTPSNKKVEYGDILLMDFGARYEGYIADMTRTIGVGRANEKQRHIYETVKETQETAIDSIKAKVEAKAVYEAAKRVIEKAGYIEFYYTGLGHGVGLVVHEEPFLKPTSQDILDRNCVITVEPGIYIPRWGGVRIEDMVLITEEGCELLTQSSRELIVL